MKAKKPSQNSQTLIDCIVVGGVANGLFLRNVRRDAGKIRLSRPLQVKPLVSATQKQPEVVKEEDTYEVHTLFIQDDSFPNLLIYGIAVVEGQTLAWAFTQLIQSHVENATRQMVDAQMKQQTH